MVVSCIYRIWNHPNQKRPQYIYHDLLVFDLIRINVFFLFVFFRADAGGVVVRFPVFGVFLLPHCLEGLAIVLVGDETFEPFVLHLELLHFVFELQHLIGHLLGLLLECLLALLLLNAEAGGRGCIATTLVLLGSEARLLFQVGGRWQSSAYTCLPLLADLRAVCELMAGLRRVLAMQSRATW